MKGRRNLYQHSQCFWPSQRFDRERAKKRRQQSLDWNIFKTLRLSRQLICHKDLVTLYFLLTFIHDIFDVSDTHKYERAYTYNYESKNFLSGYRSKGACILMSVSVLWAFWSRHQLWYKRIEKISFVMLRIKVNTEKIHRNFPCPLSMLLMPLSPLRLHKY